jgi:hypothetical protein
VSSDWRREDPDSYSEYAAYLDSPLWPSSSRDTVVDVESMAPQNAASSLAKLVRWARFAPQGEVALYPDEDSREEAVRKTRLGMHLAARACNMVEEHFHAMYGEYGVGTEAALSDVVGIVLEALHEQLKDWPVRNTATLAWHVTEALDKNFQLADRPRR